MKNLTLALALLVLLFNSGCTDYQSEVKELSVEERMEWWQEARFGMFIHWGIYAVPAGFYKGKAQTNSAEWIMNKGKIPVAEYERFAAQFNPAEFNAKELVGMAKEAGMKYLVITAKHHDGFSMFDSECSDYNIVDATPFGRDVLEELARACRKQGIRFGFYYSQAQDWHHPGGMGNNWDESMVHVSSEEYVREKAIPEVRQLLTEYGPIAIFWWDTPREMDKELVDSLYHMTRAHQPAIICNDRLGEDYPGDHKTFERRIPGEAPGETYWEVCMPISGSWGYRSDDQNFKSRTTLVRNLVDIASKGGNYLLNVSPTARGTLVPEAVDRLKFMGKWMDLNSESIYGTQASPCLQPDWGRITMKTDDEKAILYLNVFDWSDGGELPVHLNNRVESCYLLTDMNRTFTTVTEEYGIVVKLKGEAPDSVSSVIVLRLTGMPEAIARKPPGPNERGVVSLQAERAHFQHPEVPRASYLESKDCIGQWTSDKDQVYWPFTIEEPGNYIITAEVAGQSNSEFIVSLGGQSKNVKISASGDYDNFNPLTLGTFNLIEAGEYTLKISPVVGQWNPVNLRAVQLIPAQV
ncbi:MAG: alpha-L-fucosidase [Bacteroides sp.]|nr:alpha-L-fucosidase [Bacteroides sp.]